MGEGKRRTQRFLEQHPLCCFCGTKDATTRDHVPNRACFKDKAGPDGFEFPACDECQAASRLDELAFAFLVQITDHEKENYDQRRLANLLSGVRNNLSDLQINTRLTANEKRRALKALGLPRPKGLPLVELPLVSFDADLRQRVNRYVEKIVLAVFYRHVGKPAPSDAEVFVEWSHTMDRGFDEAVEAFAEITPILDLGKRSNLDFGNRFGVRVNYSEELVAFAALGQFGNGIRFVGLIMQPDMVKMLDPPNAERMRPRSLWRPD